MSNEEKQLKRIYSSLQFMENNIDVDMFESDKLQSVESIQVFFKILFCSMFDDRDSILVFQQIDSAYEEASEMEDEERIEFISKYADKEAITNFAKEVYGAPYDEEDEEDEEEDDEDKVERITKHISSSLDFLKEKMDLEALIAEKNLPLKEATELGAKIIFCSIFNDNDISFICETINESKTNVTWMNDEEKIEFLSQYIDKDDVIELTAKKQIETEGTMEHISSSLDFLKEKMDLKALIAEKNLPLKETIELGAKIIFCSIFDEDDIEFVCELIDDLGMQVMGWMTNEEKIEFLSQYIDRGDVIDLATEVYDVELEEKEDWEEEYEYEEDLPKTGFGKFLEKGLEFLKNETQQHRQRQIREWKNYIKKKSDTELLTYLKRADSNKEAYSYVLEEAQRRNLI